MKRKALRGWDGVGKGTAYAKPKAGVGLVFRVGWWG